MNRVARLSRYLRLHALRRYAGNNRGNVGIFTALSIMALIFFVALAIDLGFLTMEKESLQNKVESATESAIRVLNRTGTAGAIEQALVSLQKNGEEIGRSELASCFHLGFYDFKDAYADFGLYRDFAFEGEIPPGESINAVAILDLKKDVDTLEIKPSGRNRGRIGASAMAYGKNYTFLALDRDAQAMRWSGWTPGHCRYQNCLIGSNGGIEFNGTESFDSTTMVEAVGNVRNGDSSIIRQSAEIKCPPIDWERLRQDAETHGKVYDIASWTTTWQRDNYGNFYKSEPVTAGYARFLFLPHGLDLDGVHATSGDHEGRTYFFEAPEPSAIGANRVVLYFLNDSDPAKLPNLGPAKRQFWNLTLAGNCDMSTYPYKADFYGYGGHPLYFGNVENYGANGVVAFYCKNFGNDTSVNWYTCYGGDLIVAEPRGVYIRTDGMFTLQSQNTAPVTFFLKVVAQRIYLYSPTWRRSSITFVGGFGPSDIFAPGWLEKTRE